MKLKPVVPAATFAVVLIGGSGVLTAAAISGVASSARSAAAVGSVTPTYSTGGQSAGNAAVLSWSSASSMSKRGVGLQWVGSPTTFISHMTAGPAVEEAAMVRSVIIKLGDLVPVDPGTEPVGQDQASQPLAC